MCIFSDFWGDIRPFFRQAYKIHTYTDTVFNTFPVMKSSILLYFFEVKNFCSCNGDSLEPFDKRAYVLGDPFGELCKDGAFALDFKVCQICNIPYIRRLKSDYAFLSF